MGQETEMASILARTEKVSVPFRRLSEQEWGNVPRSVPNWILSLGTWLPVLGLLIWLIGCRGHDLPWLAQGWWGGLTAAVGAVAVMVASGRQAPWVAAATCLALVAWMPWPPLEQRVLALGAGCFGLLGGLGMLSGLRFTRSLRTWRREAVQSVMVEQSLLQHTAARKQVAPWLAKLSAAGFVYGLARVGFDYFTDAQQQVDRIQIQHLQTAAYGLIGLAFWGLLVLVRFAAQRFVGPLVLRIPVGGGQGGAIHLGALSGVVARSEASEEDCRCGAPASNFEAAAEPEHDDPWLAEFVPVHEECARHGVQAVNSMSRQEFVRHALNPWVWAEHGNDQLIPAGTELEVVGLSGWDCRPLPVDSGPVSTLGSPQGRLALYPHRVSEVLRRNRRTVRWRARRDVSLEPVVWQGQPGKELDRIPLTGVGIDGSAVRVEGRRPYLLPHRQAG